MRSSIAEIVSGFKRKWTEVLSEESIEAICREVGHNWRERILGPGHTIQLFLLQVLHGNTAISHLPHLSHETFSAAAYCLARARTPLRVFELLLERLSAGVKGEELEKGRWHGHRTFLADGSSFSMPDTEALQKHFGQPRSQKKGCGFPVCRFLTLFHAGTGMLRRVFTAGVYGHDMKKAAELHPELEPDDVLVADRGLCSYAHFCLLKRHGLHAVIRLHGTQEVSFSARQEKKINPRTGLPKTRRLELLGVKDQLIEWSKPNKLPLAAWLSRTQRAELPSSIVVRVLEYRVTERGFRSRKIVLVTTLLDESHYSAEALAELYRSRWAIELAFRNLKVTLGMSVLHSTTVDGILKELAVFCIVFNLVALVIGHIASEMQIAPSCISFIDALRWLQTAAPHQAPPTKLLLLPARPQRVHPRMRKRRPKSYQLMIKSRSELIKDLYSRKLAA